MKKELTRRKFIQFASLAFSTTVLPATAWPAFINSSETEKSNPDRTLIVYLSRTGNTRKVAEMIHSQTGGTLQPLHLQTPYPDDYKTTVAQFAKENEEGILPPLATRIADMDSFDLIYIGFPTWGMKLPPPLKTFLSDYNFSGKTIIPFNTNAGYGVGRGFSTIGQLCPKANILRGFTIKGGIERDGILLGITGEYQRHVKRQVEEWLKDLSTPSYSA